jgi:ElaB/YqjD/DUF883 family membrane-anchored ribosome-binding protein
MPSTTEQAVKRLEAALQSLEHAVERRLAQAGNGDLADEVQMLARDRARLAEELDQSQARAQRLEGVSRDVSRRLTSAMEAVEVLLQEEPEGR